MTTLPIPSTTGLADLDAILGGGLTPGTLVFLVGTPGAGKTILASQIVLQAVHTGAKGLIFTAFSEGPVKFIEHLRPFAFFDEALVGGPLTFLALPGLIEADPDAAAATLARTIRESGASMVLLDGFHGIADLFDSPRSARRLLATLASLMTYLHVTLVVTLEGDGRDPTMTKDLATADTVLGLTFSVVGQRHTRYLEVIKQRGQAPLSGLHPYTITAEGIALFPRLESRQVPEARPRPQGRAGFGLSELDELLGGGLNAGTVTLMAGAPGSGKTTLALYWALAEADADHQTAFFSFGEREAELLTKAAAFGLDLEPALASKALVLRRLSAVNLEPDIVAAEVVAALTVTTKRVIIDEMAGLVRVLGTRAQEYLSALGDQLYAAGVTSLFMIQIDAFTGFKFDLESTPLSLVADNVVIVQQVAAQGTLHRLIAILKMRYSAYDQTLRELILDEKGIRVLAGDESLPGVLEEASQGSEHIVPSDAVPETAEKS